MKKSALILGLGILATTALAADTASLRFDSNQLRIDPGPPAIAYANFERVAVTDRLTLPALRRLVRLPDSGPAKVTVDATDQMIGAAPADLLQRTPTSGDNHYRRLADRSTLGRTAVEVLGEEWRNGERFVGLLIFPVSVDSSSELTFHEQLTIRVNGEAVAESLLLDPAALPGDSRVSVRERGERSSLGAEPDYAIVTAARFVPALQRLRTYRIQTGHVVEIMTVEAITAQFAGIDPAAQVRAYLQDFAARGGVYVLLAGDETVVPNRLVYQYNITGTPSEDLLQPSDLYFADLTGDWDSDHDGVWGERTNDSPDLTEELYVGRLPLADSAQFERYTDNLIRYETDPGDGDRAWLTRALFYASDQMRDYQGGGQHATLAASLAGRFAIDTSLAVEQASGDDLAPNNLPAAELDNAVADAYGLINIIAHGRSDGFVVRSSGYNDWPKSLLLIADEAGDQGCFDSLFFAGKPSFYISLACDNGGYDLGPVGAERRSMVQTLLGTRDGAVGFVGNTRWGWVSSSYLLHRAFLDSLVAHPEAPAVAAMYRARKVFPYYRDLVYGLNYFGDPALRVYVDQPRSIDMTVERDGPVDRVLLLADGAPVSGAQVSVTDSAHQLVVAGFTDTEGRLTLGELAAAQLYTLTAVKSGCLTLQESLGPSIITGIDDDLAGLPSQYDLAQNYPNPFNPATTIRYDLPKAGRVQLSVYNILGQKVATLVDRPQPAGTFSVTWDAGGCASGVYFYRLETESFTAVRKMLLTK